MRRRNYAGDAREMGKDPEKDRRFLPQARGRRAAGRPEDALSPAAGNIASTESHIMCDHDQIFRLPGIVHLAPPGSTASAG